MDTLTLRNAARLKEVAHFHNNFSPSCAKGAGVRACNDTQAALARRMGKGDSGAVLLPLSVTGTAVVLTLLVFWWWSKRSVGRGSRGTRFTHEDGQPVRPQHQVWRGVAIEPPARLLAGCLRGVPYFEHGGQKAAATALLMSNVASDASFGSSVAQEDCAESFVSCSFRRNRTSVTRWSPDDLVRAVAKRIAVYLILWAHGVDGPRKGRKLGLCTWLLS